MEEKKFTCGIDLGSSKHYIIIHDNDGKEIMNEEIEHKFSNFNETILKFKEIEKENNIKLMIGMEGKNGYGKPFDNLLMLNGFEVYNVSSTKLKDFRSIFGSDDKTDERDARMIAILLKNTDLLKSGKEKPFEKMKTTTIENEKIRILSRYQISVIDDRRRETNRFTKKILEFCPKLLDLGNLRNITVLKFLEKYPDVSKYKKIKINQILKIKGIGNSTAKKIYDIIHDIDYDKILLDEYTFLITSFVKKIIVLSEEEKSLDKKLEKLCILQDDDVKIISSLDGAGLKNACRLAGEIGKIENFSKESKLASFFGIACLNNNSGKKKETKTNYKCNKICKTAILSIASMSVFKNKKSKVYYNKKRNEYGYKKKGSHNHAIRCLARQLTRVIYKMLNEKKLFNKTIERVEDKKEVA